MALLLCGAASNFIIASPMWGNANFKDLTPNLLTP